MERKTKTEGSGKWFCIVKKVNATEATKLLDKEIQELYQHIVPNNLRLNNIPIPCWVNTTSINAFGSYTEVLHELANPQKEETTETTGKMNKN
eukprot:6878-Ditylum_brightwellii.AAC.1